MPYKKRKKGNKWEVYNPDTGKVYGTHSSEEKADAQIAALYANTNPEEEVVTLKVRKKKIKVGYRK